MIKFLKRGLSLIRKNPEILYSVFLIIFIPLVIYYNTFFTIKSFQENQKSIENYIDFIFHSRSLLIESIVSIFIADAPEHYEKIQTKIEQISQENPEIVRLFIALPKEKKFEIVASKDIKERGKVIDDFALTASWTKNQKIVHPVERQGERFWDVVSPFFDKNGEPVGLISISFSLKKFDKILADINSSFFRTIQISYFFSFGSIIIVLFLVIQHTKLFGYLDLYRKLQEIDKMKDDFIRMAVHELQSPVVNIRAYIETLNQEVEPVLNKEQKEYFKRVAVSAKNLNNLVEDLLQVARLEQGRLPLDPLPVNPIEIIKETIGEFRLKAEEKNLQLIFKEPQEKNFLIFVNPNRLREILVNFIGNAIKYTLKGKVEVFSYPDKLKENYLISIKDTGVGLSAQSQKKLFTKFYRVKTRETAGIPGTGLGLWLSKEMTEKMGGKVFLESMEGVGSKFTISFPIYKT